MCYAGRTEERDDMNTTGFGERAGFTRAAKTAAAAFILLALSSCSRLLGYGVLLWSIDDPSVAAGTVLPVHIRSNINGVWVVSAEDEAGGKARRFELPIWKLEFAGSRGKAEAYSEAFSEFASAYAEAVQDGLPIRAEPDNNANRNYRLKLGQVVKVLGRAKGNPAMSGDSPLPGEWLKVLTDDGQIGYCFSYRLRLFRQERGSPVAAPAAAESAEADPKLDLIFSTAWHPEVYKEMIDTKRIDLERFSASWGFFPGQDTGIVRISLPKLELSYPYSAVAPVRDRTWLFEGSRVQASLRSDTVLSVQYIDAGGAQRSAVFVALPSSAEDFIARETERRDSLFLSIVRLGPVFRSENYGTLAFTSEGGFAWTGYDILVPSIIPSASKGTGRASLRLFLSDDLATAYSGALSLSFDPAEISSPVNFLYTLEPGGLRLEYLPPSSLEGVLAQRRGPSPTVIFFSSAER